MVYTLSVGKSFKLSAIIVISPSRSLSLPLTSTTASIFSRCTTCGISLGNTSTSTWPVVSSKVKNAIALCLEKEGYVNKVSKKVKKNQPVLEIELTYVDQKPKIKEVERISKQSRRVYFGIKNIHTVKNGSGLLVLSTPKGILSGKDARKEHVGGEALFTIF